MIIDVISFNDEQFAALSEEQLLEVKSVQLKVNKLRAEIDEIAIRAKFKMLKNGVVRSTALDEYILRETEKIEQEIETLREGLLFYLRFSLKPEAPDDDAPYPLDYSLSYADRYAAVKGYYDGAYPDATDRYQAFAKDEIAKVYLGEFFPTLHDLYKYQANA